MEKNLQAYVKVYDNWLDADKCKQTIIEMENANWQQHTFYNAQDGSYTAQSGNRELDVAYGNISTKPYIMQRIWDSYQKYTTDLNFPWWNSWQGFSEVRFNKYSEDRLMALHCDHITTLFSGDKRGIPTMSCLSILNDDFEGGEFIMFGDEEIKFKTGSTVIFPSCFLFPHGVQPVTKGTRYSCISWAW